MISGIHVRLTWELNIFTQFGILLGELGACYGDKVAQATYDAAKMFVKIRFWRHVMIMLRQSGVWFDWRGARKGISISISAQNFLTVMLNASSSGLGSLVSWRKCSYDGNCTKYTRHVLESRHDNVLRFLQETRLTKPGLL